MHLCGSAFLANLTTPNKQSLKVKLEFKSRDHVSNSETINKIIIFRAVKVAFNCFKQLLFNVKQKFEFLNYLIKWRNTIISSGRSSKFFG